MKSGMRKLSSGSCRRDNKGSYRRKPNDMLCICSPNGRALITNTYNKEHGEYQVLTVVIMKSTIFWDMMPPAFMLVSCSAYSLTLNMETLCSSKMLVGIQGTTWHYIPEDGTLQRTWSSTECWRRADHNKSVKGLMVEGRTAAVMTMTTAAAAAAAAAAATTTTKHLQKFSLRAKIYKIYLISLQLDTIFPKTFIIQNKYS
jgi:hypothetical protein